MDTTTIQNVYVSTNVPGLQGSLIATIRQTGRAIQHYRAGSIGQGNYGALVPITEAQYKEWLLESQASSLEIQDFEAPEPIEALFEGVAPVYSRDEYAEFSAWRSSEGLPRELRPQISSTAGLWKCIWVSHQSNGLIWIRTQGVFFAGGATVNLIPSYFPDELRREMALPVDQYGRCAALTIDQAKRAWSALCRHYAVS